MTQPFMQRTLTLLAGMAAFLFAQVSAPAQEIQFPDFSTTTGLTLNGAAAPAAGVLRVVPDAGSQAGSVFWSTPLSTQVSFNTQFQIQISGVNSPSYRSDGMAFVIHADSRADTALGTGGGAMGYGGGAQANPAITPSVVVEFDIYGDGGPYSQSHVGLMFDGMYTQHAIHTNTVALLDDGAVKDVSISYDVQTKQLSVFLSEENQPPQLLFTYPVDIQAKLGASAWFGFTAGTGGGYAAHDVLNWELDLDLNQTPVAVDAYYAVSQTGTLNEGEPGVLVNDTDPDGDPITMVVVSDPEQAATFQWNDDGSFSYAPLAYFSGTDTFTYLANDGTEDSNVATVEITVTQPDTGGFITGGGKLSAGSGKRTFGLVAKDLGGGVKGNLEFQDHAAGLNVKSDLVDWVYAPDQTEGFFSGACTVNGVAGHTFFVELHDGGGSDDITVWVFDALGAVVYSSGDALSSGNIKIH